MVAERLETGEALSVVADDLRLAVVSAQALTRTTTPEGELTEAGVTSAFGGPEGHVAISPASTPLARVVLQVERVTTPAFFSGAPDLESAEQVLNGQISLELIRLYVAEVQNDLDVRLNQAALNQLFTNTPTPQRPTPNLPL